MFHHFRREGHEQIVAFLHRVNVPAQAVQIDGLQAVFSQQPTDFPGEVGGHGGDPAPEHAVAGRANGGDDRFGFPGKEEYPDKAIHRPIGNGAVIDLAGLHGFAQVVDARHFVQVVLRFVDGAADGGRDGGDVGVVHKAAALVILDGGAGVGMDAHNKHPLLGNAQGFRMSEYIRAHRPAQPQQITADDQGAFTLFFQQQRAGV